MSTITLVEVSPNKWIAHADYSSSIFGRPKPFDVILALLIEHYSLILTLSEANEATGRNPE